MLMGGPRHHSAITATEQKTGTDTAPHALPFSEISALIQDLNARLLASDSASKALEKWCADRHIVTNPRISAKLLPGLYKPATPQLRVRLDVDNKEVLRYRRVHLFCGDHLLVEADNWYVPSRLTPGMNRILDTTDIPFGRAIGDLKPTRRTTRVNLLWSDNNIEKPLAIPARLFDQYVAIIGKDKTPLAEVVETYCGILVASSVGIAG